MKVVVHDIGHLPSPQPQSPAPARSTSAAADLGAGNGTMAHSLHLNSLL
jgi:hypothetical protein